VVRLLRQYLPGRHPRGRLLVQGAVITTTGVADDTSRARLGLDGPRQLRPRLLGDHPRRSAARRRRRVAGETSERQEPVPGQTGHILSIAYAAPKGKISAPAAADPNKKPPPRGGGIELAASYSPTGSPLQYHWRWKA